jgi:hypothetical protein
LQSLLTLAHYEDEELYAWNSLSLNKERSN